MCIWVRETNVSSYGGMEKHEADAPNESEILLSARSISAGGLIGYVLQLVCREIRCIGNRPQMWYERSSDLTDRLPVYTSKEWMSFDMLYR